MPQWLDPLIFGIRNLYANGVLQTFFPGLNFGAGLTVTPTTSGYATVTANGAAATPNPTVLISASGNVNSPTTNTDYYVTSSSAITVTITGTPTDGVRLRFFDQSKNWSTYPLTFVSQSGGTVRNPKNLAGASGGSASVNLSGSMQEWEWSLGAVEWLSAS